MVYFKDNRFFLHKSQNTLPKTIAMLSANGFYNNYLY